MFNRLTLLSMGFTQITEDPRFDEWEKAKEEVYRFAKDELEFRAVLEKGKLAYALIIDLSEEDKYEEAYGRAKATVLLQQGFKGLIQI